MGDRLAIGNVTQADFISETMSLMDSTSVVDVVGPRKSASASHSAPAAEAPQPTIQERVQKFWSALAEDVGIFFHRTWILLRDRVNAWVTPDPQRSALKP